MSGYPHVLLLDEGFASGTIAALGLRDAGCRVTVVGCNGGRGSAESQQLTWRMAPATHDGRLFTHLQTAVSELQPDVVYPVTEPLQQLIWHARVPWSGLLFPRVSPNQVTLLSSKRRMSDWFRNRNIDVPRDRCVADASRAPVVIRGETGRGGSATAIARSEVEARRAIDDLESRGIPAMIQEYVDGPTYLVGGVFDAGRPVRLYAGEKLAQYPAGIGPAARIRSTNDAVLIATALRIFEALQWTGIASADLIRRPDGTFAFLEVNPRPWGSMRAAALCGVDLFTPVRQLMTGEAPTAELSYSAGKDFSVMPLYLLLGNSIFQSVTLPALADDARVVTRAVVDRPAECLHILHRAIRGAWGLRQRRAAYDPLYAAAFPMKPTLR